MTNANQCELTSSYVQYDQAVTPPIVYSGVSEEAINYTEPFDIVLDLEAGSTIWLTGAKYSLSVVLNDLSNSSDTIWAFNATGTLANPADPYWPTMSAAAVFPVPPGTVTSAMTDHVLQAIGVMSVGVGDPIVGVQESGLFLVTQP
jgi:hypothetical protein